MEYVIANQVLLGLPVKKKTVLTTAVITESAKEEINVNALWDGRVKTALKLSAQKTAITTENVLKINAYANQAGQELPVKIEIVLTTVQIKEYAKEENVTVKMDLLEKIVQYHLVLKNVHITVNALMVSAYVKKDGVDKTVQKEFVQITAALMVSVILLLTHVTANLDILVMIAQ